MKLKEILFNILFGIFFGIVMGTVFSFAFFEVGSLDCGVEYSCEYVWELTKHVMPYFMVICTLLWWIFLFTLRKKEE